MNLPAASPHAPLYLCHSAVVKLNNFALIPSQAGLLREPLPLKHGRYFLFLLKMDSRLFFPLILGKTPHGEARGSHPRSKSIFFLFVFFNMTINMTIHGDVLMSLTIKL